MHVNIFSNGDLALHCGGCDAQIEEESHYITLVAKKLNKTYHDISFNAASNDQISRSTIKWFEEGNTADLAIIHFTEEYRIEYIAGHNHYQTCTPFGVKNHDWPPEKYKELDYYYENIYNPFIGGDNFYKNQFLLETYFELKKIPYFFIKLVKSPTPSMWKPWCKVQHITTTHFTGSLIGSQETNPENYHHHHPSEKGHQIIADYIVDNIKDML